MNANSPESGRPISRRDFLKTLGRLAGLGFLGWIALSVGLKSAGKGTASKLDAQDCRNDGWCRPCPIAADCGLPRGQSYRQSLGGAIGKRS